MGRVLAKIPSLPPFRVKQFDEDEIVEVLRRNGWFVVKQEQVRKIDALEVVDRMQFDQHRADNLAEMARSSARREAAFSLANHLSVRQYRKGDAIQFRCRGYVIVLTDDQLDDLDRWSS